MVELTLENWDNEVVNYDGYVLIDWWGETCESCLALMPTIEKLNETYGKSIKFAKFNTSQKGTKRFCIQQRVMGLPVITVYKSDQKVDELLKDDCSSENIESLIKKYI